MQRDSTRPRPPGRLLAAAAVLVLAVTPAGADRGPGPGLRPIVGGTRSVHDHAVVALTSPLGTPFCTGTLVSPRVVLTAAHCAPAVTDLVFVGESPAADGVFLAIAHTEPYPGFDPSTFAGDLAVVVLARPSPVEPARLNAAPLEEDWLAPALRFVGFGYVGPAEDAYSAGRRTASAPITRLDAGSVSTGRAACHGDSGGPAFGTRADGTGGELLVGVTSFGDVDCDGEMTAVRVDAHLSWIQGRIAALDAPTCLLDRSCVAGCEAPDPDCLLVEPEAEPATAADGCGCGAGGRETSAAPTACALLVLALAARRRRRRRPALLVVALVLAGCAPGSDELVDVRSFCRDRPFGDGALAPELDLVARGEDGELDLLPDAPRARAPGPGHLSVSIRARNVDGCAVATVVELLDGEQVVARQGTFVELVDDRGGWGWPAADSELSFVSVPIVAARRYALLAKAQDARGRTASRTRWITVR